jgi:hypothetical protein
MSHKFKEFKVKLPKYDADVTIIFPGGKKLSIQARPSNGCVDGVTGAMYNGSLDIVLPKNDLVTCWKGNHMKDAPAPDKTRQHERMAKQLVCELPGNYDD